MRISELSQSTENIPPISHSNSSPNFTPQPLHDRNFHRRTLGKKAVLSGSLVPRWRNVSPVTTPVRYRMLRKRNEFSGVLAAYRMLSRRVRSNVETNSVSARKLAAGLWQLTAVAEVTIASAAAAGGGGGDGGGGGGSAHCEMFDPLRFQRAARAMRFPSNLFSSDCDATIRSWLKSPPLEQCPKHGGVVKDGSSLPFSEFLLEGATKWDLGYRNISTGSSRHLSCKKNLKNKEVAIVPIVTVYQAKLEQVRVRIMELQAEQKSCEKEVVLCLRKLGEEKTSWMRKERQKLRMIVEGLKNELRRERFGRKRVQIANAKLLNDIADSKSAVEEIMQNYEKERKTRELMEEVCHELAKKIEEDKIKMETSKRQLLKLREQLEVERKMLQLADVWREERVKIKMADAKLILEEKCRQLNNLIADLEDFLRSKDESQDMIEISEGEVIRQAVKSAEVREIADILCSTIDDYQNNQVRKTERNQSDDSRCVQNGSEIESNPVQKSSSGYIDNGVTRNKEQGSSCTPDVSNRTVDRKSTEKTISTASCLTGHESLKSEISDMCSALLEKRVTRKPLAINWQLKLSGTRRDNNVDNIIPVERRGRFGNRSTPKMGRVTPAGTLVERGLSHDTTQQGNPHITRAMKGCLEWPQGISKNGLKGKLLDSSYGGKRSENLVA